VIEVVIQPLFDPAFDHAEVTHHPLGVEGSIQYQLHRPGLPQQPPFGVKVGKIQLGQIIDEKLHGGLASSLECSFQRIAPQPARFRPLSVIALAAIY